MLLPAEIRDMRSTRMGLPIVGDGLGMATPSGFVYRGAGPIHFASSTEPTMSIVRPTGSAPRVTFADTKVSMSG